jgi:hypothetical protein
MAGRPPSFAQKTADIICERLADGESLRAICTDPNMPGRTTVFKWLAENDAFANQYMHAREAQADFMAEQILEIADDTSHDTIPKVDKDGNEYGEMANSEWINRSRLRVDARKWLASKMAPKKYGEKIQAEHTGADGSPLQIQIVRFGTDEAKA